MKSHRIRIETDYILHGENPSPTGAELSEWLKDGHDEHYVIQAIKRHLLTEEQRISLFTCRLDIADVLNGRFSGDHEQFVMELLDAWNAKLGDRHFHF